MVGHAYLATQAKPDGYTVGVIANLMWGDAMLRAQNRWAYTDLEPIGYINSDALIWIGPTEGPYKGMSVKQIVQTAKDKPNTVRIATVPGSMWDYIVDQVEAGRLLGLDHVVLLCGRYEGIDERVRELVATEELSIGDFVVSGGETPALIVIDAVSRLVPGVVGDQESVEQDSFAQGILDHPHYTRPAEFAGRRVPDVLLSGHHAEVRKWRTAEALRRTQERRPDLIDERRRTESKETKQ